MNAIKLSDFCFSRREEKKKEYLQYLLIGFVTAACVFLMLVPENLYSTLSSPDFVTYMGIGNGEIRIDVRQTEDIARTTMEVAENLINDERVASNKKLFIISCRWNEMQPDGRRG